MANPSRRSSLPCRTLVPLLLYFVADNSPLAGQPRPEFQNPRLVFLRQEVEGEPRAVLIIGIKQIKLLLTIVDGKTVGEVGESASHHCLKFSGESIDQLIFGDVSFDKALAEITKASTLRIKELDQKCGLNRTQLEKLDLLAKRDIQLFSNSVQNLKRQFELASIDEEDHSKVFEMAGRLLESAERLQHKVASGVHDEQSLLCKSINRILTPEQIKKSLVAD